MRTHAGSIFEAGLFDPDWLVLLDTAEAKCCAFDLRAVFQTSPEDRPIVLLGQAKRYDPSGGVPAGNTKKAWAYVETAAFSDTQIEARKTARRTFNKLGADVEFLTVHTGDASRLESQLQPMKGQGENLVFLAGDGLKSWLPLISARPSLISSSL